MGRRTRSDDENGSCCCSLSRCWTAFKAVFALSIVAFCVLVMVVMPTYRYYGAMILAGTIVVYLQLWRFTPCDRRRVQDAIDDALRLQRRKRSRHHNNSSRSRHRRGEESTSCSTSSSSGTDDDDRSSSNSNNSTSKTRGRSATPAVATPTVVPQQQQQQPMICVMPHPASLDGMSNVHDQYQNQQQLQQRRYPLRLGPSHGTAMWIDSEPFGDIAAAVAHPPPLPYLPYSTGSLSGMEIHHHQPPRRHNSHHRTYATQSPHVEVLVSDDNEQRRHHSHGKHRRHPSASLQEHKVRGGGGSDTPSPPEPPKVKRAIRDHTPSHQSSSDSAPDSSTMSFASSDRNKVDRSQRRGTVRNSG